MGNLYLFILLASSFSGTTEIVYTQGNPSYKIAVIPVQGIITDQTASFLHNALTHLRDHPPKALVLRVDSPGGGVTPSDHIWHDLKEFKEKTKTPIVASFGSTAASGGYYIACLADRIVVEPTTITGSIGVIAEAFTVQELLNKIGVTPEIIAATNAIKKDRLNPMRAWTDEDRTVLRGILDEAYERFVHIVAQGRQNHLTDQQARTLATGEIFTAAQALDHKLADDYGYLDDAIVTAKTLADIPPNVDPKVIIVKESANYAWLNFLKGPDHNFGAFTPHEIRNSLETLTAPRLQYLWTGGQHRP
jgi:protease-4